MFKRPLRDQLADIRNQSELKYQIERLVGQLGCSAYALGYCTHSRPEDTVYWVENYLGRYEVPEDYLERDPLAQRVIAGPSLFEWGKEDYIQRNALDIWQLASEHGIHSGYATSLRPHGDSRLMLSIVNHQPLSGSLNDRRVVLEEFGQFARMLAGVVMDTFESLERFNALLTEQEKEALRWVFHGCTTQQVADRMRLSYGTAYRILHDAAVKAGTNDPLTAAFSAARSGVLGAV
ncbi:autoinducer binding domain-containing protein [Parachitinimonas caeni]|uniref:Autoinducer binding domain-containing protein n=1 Tax=Parachitinimonas caeni TaxID=3031301 RepID=A0ABT7DWL8_9NEIS|nr:autoinducer binding domain-containing protein [Parachitinimonas caeni]MDK2124453.1 autoinducer binding domain-containing protein [Parachitinimonas caeni]